MQITSFAMQHYFLKNLIVGYIKGEYYDHNYFFCHIPYLIYTWNAQ